MTTTLNGSFGCGLTVEGAQIQQAIVGGIETAYRGFAGNDGEGIVSPKIVADVDSRGRGG